MNFYLVSQYFKFLSKSTNQHGVHSPFIYTLVTKCFYHKKKLSSYNTLKAYRQQLLVDKNHIKVTDFGAGSKVFTSNNRQIRLIAKNAGITLKRAKLLYRLVNYFTPTNTLEIGTSVGLATIAIAQGNTAGQLTTLEGCPETAKVATQYLNKFKNTNVTVVNTEFTNYINQLSNTSFDFIFFDGNHTKAATLAYFESLLTTKNNNTVWVFDDIHWSKEMTEAWEIIKQHPEVTATIDTFYWGIVFFRKEQLKENFIIRV